MTAEAVAIRLTTQIARDMFKRRKLRPQVLYRSIERAITICENNGRNMKNYKDELAIANEWLSATNPKFVIPADVLIFRFFRAIPITTKSKKKMLAALQGFDVKNTKKWRSIPQSNHITRHCSSNVQQHIDVLRSVIQKARSLDRT